MAAAEDFNPTRFIAGFQRFTAAAVMKGMRFGSERLIGFRS